MVNSIFSRISSTLRLRNHDFEPDRSLRFSLYDGFFYSLMVGLGETYFGAYGVYLGANNFQLAILASLPPFMAGISQFFTLTLLGQFKSRRKMIVFFALLQGVMLIPAFFSFYIPSLRLEFYILFVVFYTISGMVIGPVWNSWIGDLVPPERRGNYFGLRNRVITIGTFLSMIFAGFWLKELETNGHELLGFGSIFLSATLLRMFSVYYISKKHDPVFEPMTSNLDQFIDFVKNIFSRNEGRLIVYMSLINFAVFLSAAYCTPYLLRTLKYSYGTFVVVISAVALAKVVSSSFWGEIVDSLGARKVFQITGLFIPLSILPWAFTGDPLLLILSQFFSGFIWAGYELSTFTFLLDATQPTERARVASYANIFTTSAALFGGVVGAIALTVGPVVLHEFGLIFILSGVFRFISYFLFMPKIQEVRIITPVKASNVFMKATGFRPAIGFTSRLVVFRKRPPKL